MKDCGDRVRTNEPTGTRYKSSKDGRGPKAAFVPKLESVAQKTRKMKAICEPRPSRNPERRIDSGASEQAALDGNFFTSLGKVGRTQIELTNGMIVTSSGKGSTAVGTGSESFSLGPVYFSPSLRVNLMSCCRLDAIEVTTSIAKGHCSFYHRADNNSLLKRVPRRSLEGLLVGHIQLPRK